MVEAILYVLIAIVSVDIVRRVVGIIKQLKGKTENNGEDEEVNRSTPISRRTYDKIG